MGHHQWCDVLMGFDLVYGMICWLRKTSSSTVKTAFFATNIVVCSWLVVQPPLWKIWVRQWRDDDKPNINGKIELMATKPPTRFNFVLLFVQNCSIFVQYLFYCSKFCSMLFVQYCSILFYCCSIFVQYCSIYVLLFNSLFNVVCSKLFNIVQYLFKNCSIHFLLFKILFNVVCSILFNIVLLLFNICCWYIGHQTIFFVCAL